jgi:hypothetical protein
MLPLRLNLQVLPVLQRPVLVLLVPQPLQDYFDLFVHLC